MSDIFEPPAGEVAGPNKRPVHDWIGLLGNSELLPTLLARYAVPATLRRKR